MKAFLITLTLIFLVFVFIEMFSVFGWYTVLIYLGFFTWFYITTEGV